MEENATESDSEHTDPDEEQDNLVVLMEAEEGAPEEGQARGEGDAGEDANEEQFDITLPATHSYLGGLEPLPGRRVLEAGWAGRVAGAAHHGALFPGESVPMLLPPEPMRARILADRLFCLLAPDETGTLVSGYGVLCEVQAGDAEGCVLARAAHRVRMRPAPRRAHAHLHNYSRMQLLEVVVLPELAPPPPLHAARLTALDALRRPGADTIVERRVRRLDAAGSAWPHFVWRLFDYRRLRQRLAEHFATLHLEDKMPADPVSLSFWVSSNLALSARDRLALLAVDSALLRLSLALRCVERSAALCCGACGAEVARRDHVFAMSTDGVHANYTNLGGFMHDIVTVRWARNTQLGAPSAEFSWFPGYAWRVASCAACRSHVGWRFDAQKRSLRPAQFYALCRNVVQPRDDAPERTDLP